MGASAKTLSRLVDLYARSLLPNGAAVIELGAQELHCKGQEAYVREVIRYFAKSNPTIRDADSYSDEEVRAMSDRGMFGRVLKACGFGYRALDIFEADDTTLFDLNLHDPGDDLAGRFDLVTNFGTTEHVINQLRSMQTMHALARPGGLIYHDLPLSGYHNHGYFSYNPLFFRHLAEANGYRLVMQHYSRAARPSAAPDFMTANGYPAGEYFDMGIEFILQKTSAAPFRLPLETSTSLAVTDKLWRDGAPYGETAPISRGLGTDTSGASAAMAVVSSRELHRELFRRYRRRLARALGRS